MSQQLTIKNFGPISRLRLDLKDILIFIGQQASGKSTIGKAVFFFKSLKHELNDYFYRYYQQKKIDNFSEEDFVKILTKKLVGIYGSAILNSPNMAIKFKYESGMEIAISFSQKDKSIAITFSDLFKEEFNQLKKEGKKLYDQFRNPSNLLTFQKTRENDTEETIRLNNLTKSITNRLFKDDRYIIFLPAGRSLITNLSQQRYNIDTGYRWKSSNIELESANIFKLDYLMQRFIERTDRTKDLFNPDLNIISNWLEKQSVKNPKVKQVVNLAQNLIQSILKGAYIYQNETERINFEKEKNTLINFASSGQQEVVWILQFILLFLLDDKSSVLLIIEEPEAHLFPVAQKQIIDLIALLANQNNNQVLLTTHSPYILSSFNNLLYAHNLGTKKAESVARVVDPHLWIDPDRLDAYILEQGTARSIFDPEIKLIESAEIDKASDIIVETFNQLFELED